MARDFVLNCKNILKISVVALRPSLGTIRGINELDADPDAIAFAPDVALQDISDA